MNKERDEQILSEKIKDQSDYRAEKRTPLDKFEDQKFVDDIPIQDLKIETEQERDKHKTQNDSQSEQKYKADFDNR